MTEQSDREVSEALRSYERAPDEPYGGAPTHEDDECEHAETRTMTVYREQRQVCVRCGWIVATAILEPEDDAA